MMNSIPISRRTLAIVAVLIPLAGLLGYVALRSGPLAPVAVTVVNVEGRALQPAIFGVGNVEARQIHRIGPIAPGRLLRLSAEVGDAVKVGQLLGEMDPVDNDDRLRSQEALVRRTAAMFEDATARLTHASTQARRYEQLFAEKRQVKNCWPHVGKICNWPQPCTLRREKIRLVSSPICRRCVRSALACAWYHRSTA